MTSEMVSRWPVVITATVAPGDTDGTGALTPAALERLFATARAAYFARCTTLDGSTDAIDLLAEQQRGTCASGDELLVAVGATELFSDRVHMGMRVRGGSGIGVDAAWSVGVGAVTTPVRDELIALAHGAAEVL